ncbi:unnamed protein product [Ambrosiozyma monospora]|uniref:Unnamed protein product n=1 Tax=Ambrosiozyma monospora TaxID=43982 RepID=A0ACB5T0S1_AMBMO|nr:unnamed protein product [Ambrosiozyma monospora]
MDMDRKTLQAMDYICRIAELKRWIEHVLEIEIDLQNDNITDFQEYLRNGILLAKITEKFEPSLVKNIYYGVNNESKTNFKNKAGLFFKFTENIVSFLMFLKKMHVPDMFIFETSDLFEMKNFPKVVFCLHALSCILSLKGKAPNIIRLSQQDLDVTKDDLRQVQSNIRGLRMPNFDNIEDGVRVNVGVGIMPIQLMEKDDEPIKKIPKPSEINDPISPVSVHPPEPMPMFREDTPTPVETKFTTSEISEKYDAFDDSDLSKDSIEQSDKDEIPQKVDFSDDSIQINDNLLHITDDFKITIPDNFQLPDFDDLDTSSVLKKERNDLIYTTSDSESDDNFEKHFLADETIQDTNEARNLFRHYDEKIDVDVDIDAIEEKYASMIAHDNGLSINPATDRYQTYNNYETNSYTPTSFDHENYVEKSLIELQALARGSLVRYNLFINKFMMKAFTPNVITLQAFIRGNNARKQLAKTQIEIAENLMSISVLQTIVKNRGKEDKYSMVKKQLPLHETRIVELQSVVRAMQLRAKVRENRGLLVKQTQLITDLQGRIRG